MILTNILITVLIPLCAVLIAVVLTRLGIVVLPRLGFVDIPDERRAHVTPTPRGGGIAIILAFFTMAWIGAQLLDNQYSLNLLRILTPPALLIILVGVIDDRFQMSARLKLLAQIICGVLVWLAPLCDEKIRISTFIVNTPLPDWLSLAITVLIVVAIINAFNLVDGLDGVAAGLSVIACLCLAAWASISSRNYEMLMIYLILAGACLGFLRYNFSPARIFMGDTGSNFLGLFFAIGCLSEMTRAPTTVGLLGAAMAVGVPMFDTFLAFWRRLVRKFMQGSGNNKIMNADMDHLHHRLYAIFRDQRKTALALYAIAGLFVLIGLVGIYLSERSAALGYFVVILVMFAVVQRLATVEMLDSTQMVVAGLNRPRRNLLFNLSHPFFDLFCLAAAHMVANLLCKVPIFTNTMTAMPYIIIIYAVLWISGIYRIYWFRSAVRDFRYLAEMFLFGALLALLANRIFDGPWKMAFAVLYFSLAFIAILSERFVLMYLESFLLRQLMISRHKQTTGLDNVLLFGGGQGCRTYLTGLQNSYEDIFNIIGIADDDPALRGLRIYGYKVLGGRTQLDDIAKEMPFQRIIITSTEISDEVVAELKAYATSRNIPISRFTTITTEI